MTTQKLQIIVAMFLMAVTFVLSTTGNAFSKTSAIAATQTNQFSNPAEPVELPNDCYVCGNN